MTYVKQNKWKFFSTLIILGGLFFAFNTFKKDGQDTPELRHRKLLSTIGNLLESEHYSPRKIDDEFSKEVFDNYLKALDPEKNLFLQSDIEALAAYKTTIDDEIHGAPILFEPAVNAIFEKRVKEARPIFDNTVKNRPCFFYPFFENCIYGWFKQNRCAMNFIINRSFVRC